MGYLALYREWRPKIFSDIVGQEHVKTILVNALMQNKVAHAYLFSGPRGTGKTTAAKILAKALNCSNRKQAEPCNSCESCHNIDQGLALDVLEIDAASNRGIDEIRDLREKVKFTSSGGKSKVYIIDEVHMLTTEAFNALLKTLEEPPVGVVFVLATTEAHKVPLTILSRVQRFEFQRISLEGIVSRLREVSDVLGREVEEKALQVIAAKAEGGMRDALSILDQCLLREDKVTVDHVYQTIGMVGEAYNADLIDTLLDGDYGNALSKLGEGVALGRDPRQIIRELLDYLRQALLFLAGGQEPLLSVDSAQRLKEQSNRAGLTKLLSWINIILKGEGELKYASNARLAAEMILVQALYQVELVAPDEPRKRLPTYHKDKVSAQNEIIKTADRLAEGQNLFTIISTKWSGILDDVRKLQKSTHAFLLEGKPMGIKGQSVLLVFKEGYSFHRDKCDQPQNKAVIEEILTKHVGQKLLLESLMENEYQQEDNSTAVDKMKLEDETDTTTTDSNRNSQLDYSCVQQAVELFGAELVQIKEQK